MDDRAQFVTTSQCAPDEVRGILAAAYNARTITDGNKRSLDDMLARGLCFKVMHGGAIVGAYVLKIDGPEVWVMLAGGSASVDLSAHGLQLIEQQSAAFDSVGFQTRRRGLVKKAIKAGYEVHGYILRKKINNAVS